MTGTEGIAEVDEGGVNKYVLLWTIKQVLKVFEVSVAATNAVSSAVFVKHEDLTWSEPSLEKDVHGWQQWARDSCSKGWFRLAVTTETNNK